MTLAFLLTTCRGEAAAPTPPSAAVTTSTKPSAVSITSTAPSPASTSPAPIATATLSPADSGISTGTPVLIRVGDRNLPAVLVTNNSDQQRSFTLTAAWPSGATARGAVMGLQAHETRAVNLANGSALLESAGSAEAHVEQLIPNPAGMAPVQRAIEFGKPVVRASSFSILEVPATNLDSQPHGFSVGAALLSHGTLIATASGQVPNIGPRITLPVTMPLAGPDAGYDQILVYVDSVAS